MGLGKTIMTISLLAHLACEKGDWGPHLIVVPTSVMLNWEIEFKKWCPAFKVGRREELWVAEECRVLLDTSFYSCSFVLASLMP